MNESDNNEIDVRVLFFGGARDVVGDTSLVLSLKAPAKLADATNALLERHPGLKRFGRSLLFAVNQEYATPDTDVRANDELAVFPPVSGGSETVCDYRCPNDFFELTTDTIDVGAVARRVVLPECGATVTLDGYARKWTAGRETEYLVYEAYEPMALSEMQKLGAEAHKSFEIAHVGIVHRTGRLEIGETSVVIAVSAPHRRAAFEAGEWLIKELKKTVPIWKKEVFQDGEVWIEGEGLSNER
jgi:molybdopterin synthase catalytic subunit/molybdopterin converting factor small subunit